MYDEHLQKAGFVHLRHLNAFMASCFPLTESNLDKKIDMFKNMVQASVNDFKSICEKELWEYE